MQNPFTSHLMRLAIWVGSTPANRSLLLLKSWSQQTRRDLSSHELARRAFFSTLTDSKPTVSCSATVSSKPNSLDDYLTVIAVPLQDGPLIPGFFKPLYVTNPKVLAALQESKSGETPYAGAFLLTDDKDTSTGSPVIHRVGTLAQIISIQGEQVIVVGRKRLQITETVGKDPPTVKTHHLKDKPYDKDDEVIIKATYFEDNIGESNYRKLAEFLLKKRRKLTDSRAGIFEAFDFNYQKLADFGAGISDANKHKIQEVLEELDVVHKLLDLTLQLVKKQVEINKIKKFHASAFPLINYVLFSADTFRKRIEPIIEKIPKHVLKVIDENFDVLRAEAILDEDHYGLADIKERILEFIAVRTLTGNPEGKIICLSGPPGVGKTSIARSIARVLDRKFFRLAVGGLSDSSEIKGDRGVCVGAKPGKMVQCLKQVGTENPLVLLDEIDKIGKSSKYDPEGALLELLDPEQNAQFLDYFLDVPIDLSKILFVCTANDIDRLPDPLLDRMEVIKLAGYTTDEKMHITRDYLVKIVSGKCGIKPDQVDVSDTALLSLIENYCREAGVRNLQKHIENIFRKEEYGSAEYVKKNRLSDTFRKRIEPIKEKIPKHVLEVIEEELANLDRKEADYGSTNRIYSYLDWLTALPWGKCSDENFDVLRAEKILDEDHYGLRVVKERILEFIAVGNLTGNPEGRKIICLSGPPGVGKTSIARSVARALGRKFFRLAVGGLSKSSEIKGDRRVYSAATPGKMVQCLKKVGTENPLVLLDEIDKLGKSRRDPEGALLELLDPEQNAHFLDHFLDVLFVCTANNIDRLPGPLLDRMEVIELAGYTADEKMHIARDYLVKTVQRKCGMKPEQVDVSEAALLSLIENYCREAGVRNLQKHIEKIFRKIALKLVRQQASAKAVLDDFMSSGEGSIEMLHEYLRLKELEYALGGGPMMEKSRAVAEKFTIDESNLADYLGKPVFERGKLYEQTPVGVVMGLAWTSMGGSTLYIETTFVEEGKGGLHITGHLGRVMKESAEIAHTVARRIMFDKDPKNLFFANSKLHLHVPEGATPKDGPSAGCTMITSLQSLAMKKPVRKDLAMTGEVTLTGRILPIGGIKEKTMAARRSQVKVIIFPEANRRDFEGLEESVKEGLDVHFVDEYEQIFELAFGYDH
ncbi:unnamed protein product [Brassica oleracea var. botrytis]